MPATVTASHPAAALASRWQTGGKPSTWFPPEGLAEQDSERSPTSSTCLFTFYMTSEASESFLKAFQRFLRFLKLSKNFLRLSKAV